MLQITIPIRLPTILKIAVDLFVIAPTPVSAVLFATGLGGKAAHPRLDLFVLTRFTAATFMLN